MKYLQDNIEAGSWKRLNMNVEGPKMDSLLETLRQGMVS